MPWYIVHYDDNERRVHASDAAEAFQIVLEDYELEWGVGTFDQYHIEVKAEEPFTAADGG